MKKFFMSIPLLFFLAQYSILDFQHAIFDSKVVKHRQLLLECRLFFLQHLCISVHVLVVVAFRDQLPVLSFQLLTIADLILKLFACPVYMLKLLFPLFQLSVLKFQTRHPSQSFRQLAVFILRQVALTLACVPELCEGHLLIGQRVLQLLDPLVQLAFGVSMALCQTCKSLL